MKTWIERLREGAWRDGAWLSAALAAVRSPLAIFLAIFIGLVSFAFYTTPFSSQVEEYLFDVRTRIKPARKNAEEIVLVTIDEETIRRLGVGPGGRIDMQQLRRLTGILSDTAARRVAILFLQNIFDFDDRAAPDFIQAIASDSRFFLGTLSFYGDVPSRLELAPLLHPVAERAFGVDTLKKRSNSVVRALPTDGYQGLEPRRMLPVELVSDIRGGMPVFRGDGRIVARDDPVLGDWYLLNFISHDSYDQINAADLLATPERYKEQLRDKIVVVGPTFFREWMTQTREQIAANTPIQGNLDTYRDGESITYITANAIQNLLTDSWLRPAPWAAAVAQTVLVTTAFGLIWAVSVTTAVISIFGGWLLLLLAHGLLFHLGGVFVPLADTALFSSLAVIVGALARLNVDVSAKARIRTETEAKSELAANQSRYLDQFAGAMSATNEAIKTRLDALEGDPSLQERAIDRDLISRARATNADFAEYLEGIMQCAKAEESPTTVIKLGRVTLASLAATVARRLEIKMQERRIDFESLVPEDLAVQTNEQLLDHIIYNLLSNAIKYSPPGGKVTLTAGVDGRHVVIAVLDHGPGIAPELQEKIFDKFYRVKNDDVYKIKGTGLGLYLCRYFASRIGADVSCQSEVGKGSTFLVKLRRSR